MRTIDQVAAGIYRIGEFGPEYGISFNQFLIVDDAPALIHTGTVPMYEGVRKAVAEIIDPAKLKYVVIPHFEADECGGMRRFVEKAPQAELICSEMGAAINLSGWEYCGPFKGARDGTTIDLGQHKLRFLETPHVHHWDSMMVFEESTQSLFPADLFIQPGEQRAMIDEDLGKEMCDLYRGAGIFGGDKPVLQCVDRIETINPQWIHPMHGGSMSGKTLTRYIHALRTRPFTYDGMLLGRRLMG
jgi:flavorubredoxin